MSPSPRRLDGRTRRLGLALVAASGVSLAYGMLLVLPLFVVATGGDEKDFGVVLAAAAVPAVGVLLLLARRPDALPPAHVLGGAIALLAVGAGGAALVRGTWVPLVGVGILVGTAWAVVYTAAPMVVSDMVDDDERATQLGYLTGGEQLGIGLGPILAGWLHGPLGFQGTFAVAAVVALLAAACCLALPRGRVATDASTASARRTTGAAVRGVLRSSTAVWLTVIGLFACLFTTMTQFQTTFADARGLDYSVFYASYTVAVIAVRFLVAPRTARFDPGAVITVSLLLMTAAIASFLAVGASTVAYAAASAALGVGYGIALPTTQAHAVNLTTEPLRPAVLPLAGLVFQACVLGFPLLVGWIVVRTGYTAIFVLLVGLALAQLLSAGMMWRRDARRSPGM